MAKTRWRDTIMSWRDELDEVTRSSSGTYTIHLDEAMSFDDAWAPLPPGPKTMAYEGAPRAFKNRKQRRTEAAQARRAR